MQSTHVLLDGNEKFVSEAKQLNDKFVCNFFLYLSAAKLQNSICVRLRKSGALRSFSG
jgi:hypothetical protein